MVRISSIAVVLLSLVVWCDNATTQLVQAQGGQPRRMSTMRYGLPSGYHMLRMENVQKEIELLDEQKEKIEAIGKKYYEDTRKDWDGIRDMSAEERREKVAEIREKQSKARDALKGQVEAVLLPHQIDALKKINFRMQAGYAMRNPRIVEKLGLSAEQKEKLAAYQKELQEKTRELQQEMLDKALGVLTTEQKEQFEKMGSEGFHKRSRSVQATPKK